MDIVAKYTRNNEIVAWKINDDGVLWDLIKEGIYHELVFFELLNSGYKFQDYEYNVLTPSGIDIKDLPESTDYLSENSLIELAYFVETGMLEEKDIVQYFDRNVSMNFIDIPDAINPVIKTREELDSFISGIKEQLDFNVTKFIPVSLNEIVSKDALYTLDEIAVNDDIRNKFVNIFSMYQMSSFNELIKFCNVYDIKIDSEDYYLLQEKILKKFYSHGVPGINADIIKVTFDRVSNVNVDDIETKMDFTASLHYALENVSDNCIYGTKFKNETTYSIQDNECIRTYGTIGAIDLDSVKVDEISDSVKVVPYASLLNKSSITIEMMSKDGVRVKFISTVDSCRLYTSFGRKMTPTIQLFRFKAIDDVLVQMTDILFNGSKYVSDSVIIRSYIRDSVKKYTTESKYKSTFDLLVGVGITPYWVPTYMTRLIGDGIYSSAEMGNRKEFSKLYSDCSNRFRLGFSNKIISKYGFPDLEDKSIMEQVEYINEQVSSLMDRNEYLVMPETAGYPSPMMCKEYVDWLDEIQDNEINNINFVIQASKGIINLGKQAIGMELDSRINNIQLFDIIYSCYLMELDRNNLTNVKEFLTTTLESYINLDSLIGFRDKTYKGCLADEGIARGVLARECDSIIYITKIFRAINNLDILKSNKHYGFECLCISKENGTVGKKIFTSIYETSYAFLKEKDLEEYSYLLEELAAHIITNLALNKNFGIMTNDGLIKVDSVINVSETIKIPFTMSFAIDYVNKLRDSVYLRYCSIYDFIENQFNSATLKCRFYTINASVRLSNIVPREGFKIPEYNSFINCYPTDMLRNTYPSSLVDRMISTGGKVFENLIDNFDTLALLPSMDFYEQNELYDLSKRGYFLGRDVTENLQAYLIRTFDNIMEGKKEDKVVKDTLLKQEVDFVNFYELLNENALSSVSYYDENFDNPTDRAKTSNKYVSSMDVRILDSDWINSINVISNAIESSSGVKFSRLKFSELPLDKIMWNDRLCNSYFESDKLVVFNKGIIQCGDYKTPHISKITEDDLNDLCNLGVAIKLGDSEYIIKTANSLLKVGVN